MGKKTKKLINSPEKCVDEMLYGIACAHPGLTLHTRNRVILLKQWYSNKNKVALISGGGSGHEPFAGGYVGSGMLSGAVAGSVFASPPAANVLHAIRCLGKYNNAGVLVFIPNYTGDCLNFGLAVEIAKHECLKVDSVVLEDDCALLQQESTSNIGRRGMSGMVFVFKIAGALAEQGSSLYEIKETVLEILKCVATYGVSLTACSLPGSGPLFHIGETEMELGLGVHGEAGVKRIPVCSAAEVVQLMLQSITSALSLKAGDDAAVMINNLGGTSQLEQWLMVGEVHKQLVSRGINVLRIYAGPIMTSLEMAGLQVSVLVLPEVQKDKWLNCLDASTDACGWPACPLSLPVTVECADEPVMSDEGEELKLHGPELSSHASELMKRCVKAAALSLISNEAKLNGLDSGCGDGDTGSTLRCMAEDTLQLLTSLPFSYPSAVLKRLSSLASSSMGGTSGAIYKLMLNLAALEMEKASEISPKVWAAAWRAGIEGTMRYSKARPGDRTLFDALVPGCEMFEKCNLENSEESITALEAAVKAAEKGCDSTRLMKARVGRASYVDTKNLTDVDAGAYAATVWLKAILIELTEL